MRCRYDDEPVNRFVNRQPATLLQQGIEVRECLLLIRDVGKHRSPNDHIESILKVILMQADVKLSKFDAIANVHVFSQITTVLQRVFRDIREIDDTGGSDVLQRFKTKET